MRYLYYVCHSLITHNNRSGANFLQISCLFLLRLINNNYDFSIPFCFELLNLMIHFCLKCKVTLFYSFSICSGIFFEIISSNKK